MLALLRLHSLLEPFFHKGLNGGRQISHLLVAPLLEGLLHTTRLMSDRGYRITILVVPATFLGVVSQMGANLVLAVLAERRGLALLRNLFTGIPIGRTLLGSFFGDCRSGCFLHLRLETSLVLLVHDALD